MSNKKQTAVEWLAMQLYDQMKGNDELFTNSLIQAKAMEKEEMIDVLKSIESQLSELQKQSSNPNNLTKRGGEFRIGLSKSKDLINDHIYLIQNI
jgi:hypothetical protein